MSESREEQLEGRIRHLEDQLAGSPAVPADELAELRSYRDMFEGTVAILVMDPGGEIVRVNGSAAELTGWAREELVGKIGTDLVVPDERRRFADNMQDVLTVGPIRSDHIILNKDGSQRDVEVRHYPARSEGRPIVFTILVDASECRLTRCRRMRKGQADAVGQLCEGMAHQFNTLLARIMACAEETEELNLDPTAAKCLRTIVESCDEASGITESLLSFAGRRLLRRRMVNPVNILEHTLQMCEEELIESGIDVVRDYSVVPDISIDNVQMGKVFRQIVTNAIQAMPQGGRLTVSSRSEETDVIIRIADTGGGIDPKILPVMFLPFVTTKGVLSGSEIPGMGLGLCFCRGIVASHYGQMTAESSVGLGTAITITIPIDQSERDEEDEDADE